MNENENENEDEPTNDRQQAQEDHTHRQSIRHHPSGDDHAPVASVDTCPPHDSRRSRGYATNAHNRPRRDDHAHYRNMNRDRSRSAGSGHDSKREYCRPPRSRSRSKDRDRSFNNEGDGHFFGGGQNTDGNAGRFQRSGSHGDPRRGPYQDERGGDFRRGRSAPSHPPYRGNNEFEPPSKSQSPGRNETPEAMQWPPSFDKDGSAFVLHPASGMFYEENSEFFYDPKSKLYYGVRKAAYFRYDESKDPPFIRAQKADPDQGTPTNPVEQALILPSGPVVAVTKLQVQKPMIAIKLKTKKVKKAKAAAQPKTTEPSITANTTTTTAVVSTKVQKQQVANIEKWTEKQAELKMSVTPAGVSTAVAVAVAEVKRTVKGEPMCVICKRKFPSIEKLRLHESKSELHKSTVAKLIQLASSKRKNPPESTSDYHDRAEKRRQLHGPPVLQGAKVVLNTATVRPVERAAPGEGLGEGHIGNKMLQKMGWQSGSTLGKKAGEEGSNKTTENIRKDWDRIEAMASGASGRPRA